MTDPAPPDLDPLDLERELGRIPDVTAARVVVTPDGRIVEVHILSLPHKPAKQVVRDVQSVAMATFGMDLDRRVVSVVQLDAMASSSVTGAGGDEEELEAPRPSARRTYVEGVTVHHNGLQSRAQVILTRGDQRATGNAEGLGAASTVLRLVAQACIAALRHLEPAAERADVDATAVLRLGERSLAVSTVVIVVPPHEEILSGSALVGPAGEFDAMARSVLDATNRRLAELR